jgi:hypothetical protein
MAADDNGIGGKSMLAGTVKQGVLQANEKRLESMIANNNHIFEPSV